MSLNASKILRKWARYKFNLRTLQLSQQLFRAPNLIYPHWRVGPTWIWSDRHMVLCDTPLQSTNTTFILYTGNSNWNSDRKPFEHDQDNDKIFDQALPVLCRYSRMIHINGVDSITEDRSEYQDHTPYYLYTVCSDGEHHARSRQLILNHRQTESFPHN